MIEEYIRKVPPEVFAKTIDHTVLKPEATIDDVIKVIKDCERYGFATAVVPPWSIPYIVSEARRLKVKLCTVIGFPHGNIPTDMKVSEAIWALNRGVNELDMVINISALKSGMLDYVKNDIKSVVEKTKSIDPNVIIKVIIETGLLTDEEIVKTTQIVADTGGDYVKTCTGYGPRGASVHDVRLMVKAGKGKIKVKASGGIRHVEDAIALIEAGASRIGTSSGHVIYEEYVRYRRELLNYHKS